VSAASADITIVCYGGMLKRLKKAVDQLFEEHDVIAEIICPLQLYPLDLNPILESVRETRKLLIVEEGRVFALRFGGAGGDSGVRSWIC